MHPSNQHICSVNSPRTHLAGRQLVQRKVVPQLVLAGRARLVDLVAQDEHRAVREGLVRQQRVQLVLALGEPAAVPRVDQEHDRVHRREVVLPDTTGCKWAELFWSERTKNLGVLKVSQLTLCVTTQIECGESHVTDRQLLGRWKTIEHLVTEMLKRDSVLTGM